MPYYPFGSGETATPVNMQAVSHNTGATTRSVQSTGLAQTVSYNTGTPARNPLATGFAQMPSYNNGAPTRTAQATGHPQTVSYNPGMPARSAPVTGALGNLILPSQAAPLPIWYMNRKTPTLGQAMTCLPLSDSSRNFESPLRGVVKLINIPYDATKGQVLAVLGKDAGVLRLPEGSQYFDVHIIMDRYNGKSDTAFIGVSSPREAHRIVNAMKPRKAARVVWINGRRIQVEVASVEQMMTALFPYATNLEWSGCIPRVVDQDRGTALTGFLGSEELAMMARHAENPARSPYVARTPHRIYECMISTLHKFPWHATKQVTVGARKELYDLTSVYISTLAKAALDVTAPTLTVELLRELVVAALGCPGFSEQQKALLAHIVRGEGFPMLTTSQGTNVMLSGTGPMSANWPFLALNPKALVRKEFLVFYAAMVAEATTDRPLGGSSLFNVSERDVQGKPFGNLPIAYGNDLLGQTMAVVAETERNTIREALGSLLEKPS